MDLFALSLLLFRVAAFSVKDLHRNFLISLFLLHDMFLNLFGMLIT